MKPTIKPAMATGAFEVMCDLLLFAADSCDAGDDVLALSLIDAAGDALRHHASVWNSFVMNDVQRYISDLSRGRPMFARLLEVSAAKIETSEVLRGLGLHGPVLVVHVHKPSNPGLN